MSSGFHPSTEQSDIIGFPAQPLRVSAGAGTGKTTTIVHRLARFIAEGGDPARSLGITFTNKAADELRTRLREVMAADPHGKEIEVATYHSFASSILDEFGGRIGHRSGLVLMDEGHRTELAMRVLRSLEDTALDLTALNQRRDDLLTVASALVENLVEPSAIIDAAPEVPDETWNTRIALVEAASAFADMKRELGVVEYADLIKLAFELVTQHADVAREIRSRYDTVLLDEYQDTDPAQRRLLTTIFDPSTSITAVGDTDQTIYEWRGASIDNFDGFPEDFGTVDHPAPTLPLSINRRSGRRIISLANEVREQLPPGSSTEPLRPRSDAPPGDVTVAWLRTEADEANWIADQIREVHAAGIRYSEIGVLCRKRESLRPIATALRDEGIPFSIGSMGELLDVPEIADLLGWLRILSDPADEPSLLRVLMGGRYRMGMSDLAAIARTVERDSTLGLITPVLDASEVDGISSDGTAALASFSALYTSLYARAQAASVASIVADVIETLDFWSEVAALDEAARTTTRINVSRFLDLASRWRPLDGPGDLRGFLRYLSALDESGRADELDAAEIEHEDAVRLLTAHGAKGLEWSIVFLPALSEKIFPSDVRQYGDPEDTATALPYRYRLDADAMAIVDRESDPKERRRLLKLRHDAQEWRLAYVAVTRARERLVMSGHAWHGDNKRPKGPSELLELARALPGVTLGPVTEEAGERPDPRPISRKPIEPDPLFDEGWDAALRRAVREPGWSASAWPDLAEASASRRTQLELQYENLREPEVGTATDRFVTSVTNLVALAECPLKFRWIHHDRLPRRPRRSARLGTEFHRRVELHNLGILPLADADEAQYDDEGGDGFRGTPSTDPWSSFNSSRFSEERPFLIETPFELTLDGRSLRGKVDAVYGDDSHWEIVDYKSGNAPDDASGHRLVQLEAYAVAATHGALAAAAPESLDVTFAYFGTDPATEATHHTDEAWLAAARDRISTLLAVAEDGPFDASPGPSCRWCDFLHHCEDGRRAVQRQTGEN